MKVTIEGDEYTLLTAADKPLEYGSIWWIYEVKEEEFAEANSS